MAMASAHGIRFIAEERKVYDENTGQDEKLVRFARKNIRIILDTEPSDGLITLAAGSRLARRFRSFHIR